MSLHRFSHHRDSKYVKETQPRNQELNAESERKAQQRLQDYRRTQRPVESDIAWREDRWMA